jgi:hypothetical protein
LTRAKLEFAVKPRGGIYIQRQLILSHDLNHFLQGRRFLAASSTRPVRPTKAVMAGLVPTVDVSDPACAKTWMPQQVPA